MTQLGLQVVYSKRVKRMNLQRVLVSKCAYFPEQITPRDLVAIVDNMLWLQDKCASDPDFRNKFGVALKVLAYLLKNKLRFSGPRVSSQRILYLSNAIKSNLEGFLYEKRNVPNQVRLMNSLFEVRSAKPLGVLKSQLPPEKYIGKGYRDKGTAKNPAVDGSPSWQEIASQPFGRLYEIRKSNNKSYSELEGPTAGYTHR